MEKLWVIKIPEVFYNDFVLTIRPGQIKKNNNTFEYRRMVLKLCTFRSNIRISSVGQFDLFLLHKKSHPALKGSAEMVRSLVQ